MIPTIFLACHNDGKFKSEVIKYIMQKLKQNKKINLGYEIRSLFYNSFNEVMDSVENYIEKKNNVIIFLQVPNFSIRQLLFLREKIFIFTSVEDVAEHYNSFYKYIQFLYDGLFVETGYRDFFEVYGKPVYNNEIFMHDIKFLDNKSSYESLIPFSERLYDFSFIGRFDRKDRHLMIDQLKNKFKNIFYHDSSQGFISNEDFKYIISNTRYLLNSTTIKEKNSYGFKQFPEYFQLQAKSRFIEYAANGCILFTDILPINSLPTLVRKIKIPVIEIPRGVNKANYCFEYLKNIKDIEGISRKTHELVYESFMPSDINLEFQKLLNDIKAGSVKYSNVNLSKLEFNKVDLKYSQLFIKNEIKEILRKRISKKSKLIKLILFIRETIEENNLFKTFYLLIKIVLLNFIKIVTNFFDNKFY